MSNIFNFKKFEGAMVNSKSLDQMKMVSKAMGKINIGDRVNKNSFANAYSDTKRDVFKTKIQSYEDYLKEPFSVNQNRKPWKERKRKNKSNLSESLVLESKMDSYRRVVNSFKNLRTDISEVNNILKSVLQKIVETENSNEINFTNLFGEDIICGYIMFNGFTVDTDHNDEPYYELNGEIMMVDGEEHKYFEAWEVDFLPISTMVDLLGVILDFQREDISTKVSKKINK